MTQREIAKLLSDYHTAKIAASKEKELNAKIKKYMADNGLTRLEGGGYVATVTPVTDRRIDTTALKAAMPDVAAQFTKVSEQSRLYVK